MTEKKKSNQHPPHKVTLFIIGLFLLTAVVIRAADYFALFEITPGSDGPVIVNDDAPQTNSVEYRMEEFASDLFVPWSMVFTSENRMLVTERDGKIQIIENGQIADETLTIFPEVSTGSEEGLMGMAIDPDYENNKYVYVCLAYNQGEKLADKIVRFKDEGTSVSGKTTILDDIPAARFHAGCRIKFGPDGKLYITTGDATNKQDAQDPESLAGKILRINKNGTIPSDNPDTNSPVWTLGHRNPQGIAWHPLTGQLFSTEHGPSGNDGPFGGDEINIIDKDSNYGWPIVSHDDNQPGLIPPIIQFTPAVAPGSAEFYKGLTIPQFNNNLFFGGLKGEGLFRVVLTENDTSKVAFFERLQDINVGRIRDVAQGPDGYLYFSTSNQDGRGDLRDGDDHIYRLVPID